MTDSTTPKISDRRRGNQDSRVIILGKGHGGVPEGFDDETSYSLTDQSAWKRQSMQMGDQ